MFLNLSSGLVYGAQPTDLERIREDFPSGPPLGSLSSIYAESKRYAEMLVNIGYPQRYCQVMGTKTAPLIVEAESAYRELDATSANGIGYVRDNLCFPLAAGSFEDGMGA